MPNELLARLPDMLGKDNGQTYQSNGGQIGRSFTRSPVSPRRLGKQSPEQLLLSDDLFMQKVLDQLEKTVTASSQQWMNRPGGRLGSTTATADDNGDLILLLAEKERQLELAARVGQTLLEKNKDLETKNDFLEENLSKTNEQMTQLRHDLQQRCDLLRVFSNLEEDSLPRDASDESLKRRLETTRRENDRLRQKCDVMRKETEMTIAEEKQRVEILEHQLDDANERVHRLQKQIETKSLELSSQTSTVEGLLKELARKDCRGNQLRMEKEEISEMLNEMMGQHDQKVVELRQMQEQFTALKHQLSETEDELQRSRQRDALRANSFDSLYDSLASEMENSDSGVCSSRGASAAACLSQTHLQPGRAYVGASTMPLMGHHRNIQPLSLELELAEAQSQQPSASSSCHRHHDDSPVQLSETPMAPIHVLCDASTSCTNIALECGFDETDCRPPTPLATSTPLAKKKTEMKLELTEPQSVVLETKQPARTEVAPPPSTTPKRPSTPTKLVLHRSPKKSLAATLYQAMVPAVFGAKRSTSEDSLEDYEAPKMGQPGVPGTRDLDFSVKMFKARQEQFGVESRIRGLIDAAGLNCRTDPSVLFACGPSSSSSSTSSSVRLPPQSVKNPTVYTRYSRFPRSYSTSSTAQESRSPPKSDTGRKSSEGWTDFGAAYGMRLIQGLCTESSSIDGLAQMAGGGGRSSGVLTRTEMSAPQSIGTLSRPIGISLSSTMQPSQPMAGVVQRR